MCKSLIVVPILFTCLSCQSAPVEKPRFQLNHEALAPLATHRTVYVASPTLFSPRFVEHQETLSKVESTVIAQLQSHGFSVLPSREFRRAWQASERELGGLYDGKTGQKDPSRIHACTLQTTERLAEERDFSGVVFLQVVYRPVELEKPWTSARFDGVERDVQFDGGREGSRWTSFLCMTLRSVVYTRDGKIAFEGQGGLDIAQKTVRESEMVRQMPKMSEDFRQEDLDEGVSLSLSPLMAALAKPSF